MSDSVIDYQRFNWDNITLFILSSTSIYLKQTKLDTTTIFFVLTFLVITNGLVVLSLHTSE